MNSSSENKNKKIYKKIGRVLLLTFIGWKLGFGTLTLKFAFGAEWAPAPKAQSSVSEISYWAKERPEALKLNQKIYELRKGENRGEIIIY